ncbi:MAG TPA: alpha-amylase family glycosyl hydrolase [Candidatus Paceibacterota bacterium]|nr:alpha-amylase family glycosyl hydrolase [Candidatus Paceibacterota bacterium]
MAAWWKEAKIYELYVDAFAGTFPGLTEKLPYFTELGINCLHILPHYPSPMIDGGYDITDYRGVRSELGTLEECIAFIEAAHLRDIRVMFDFPLNHTSDQHPWFIEARASRESEKRDYYIWADKADRYLEAVNAFPDIKSSNWIPNPATDDLYFATFYPQQPDLNWDNPEVFDGMVSHMEFWTAHGVDAFRLDAVCFLAKRDGTNCKSLPEMHDRIRAIRARLEENYPSVALLAESAEKIELLKTYFGQGDECHLVYNFPLMEEFWMAIKDGSRLRLEAMIGHGADIPENCAWATFLRNHDEIALNDLSAEDRHALVDFLDPKHEYLFNGGEATSLRVATALRNDVKKILEAFMMLYQTPGSPIMYYGDEIGMQNLPIGTDRLIDTRRYVRNRFDWEEAQRQAADPDSLLNKTARIIRGQ